MASLGGAGNLRGFYQGRFRDNSMYSAIVEYRAHIFWKISACVFGGVGDVYDKPKNINTGSLKGSFGGGLRLTILEKENLNLRVDYGYSDNYNRGFYFTVGECF
jgi:outer membrane protein assembly factor BamA